MCGIAGIFNLDESAIEPERICRAATVQRHRGPDDEGYVLLDTRSGASASYGGPDTEPSLRLPRLDEFKGGHFDLAFGFRRLAIQDRSAAGHQPMSRRDKKLWIVFSGEVYNYLELRSELRNLGHQFQTRTDTEVLIASYQEWGDSCLDKINGVFAFAIWNSQTRQLFLARDRFGEKPLHYFYLPGRVFAFASEMKALWASGIVDRIVHQDALALYKYYGQVDGVEQTFYEGIQRLPQAHCLSVSVGGALQKRRYWDIDPQPATVRKDSWYEERFRELFTDSVRLRLRADVPIGSALSGGLDSSTVIAVTNQLQPKNSTLKTFSVRFDDPNFDEGKWIKLVTDEGRVEPHEVWPTGEQFFDELSRVFWHQEEPFTSTSVYAQWALMRLARESGVTVMLDGQGADETLAGYHTYFQAIGEGHLRNLRLTDYRDWKKSCRKLHGNARGSVGRVFIQSVPASIKKPIKLWIRKSQGWPSVEPLRPTFPREFKNVSPLRKLLWWNTTRQGLAELLRYADRNSMAHSVEVRLPFLDHRLVEFVFQLPENCLIRSCWTKCVLREAFRGIVPAAITDRVDKMGFMPPQKRWIGTRVWEDLMIGELMRGKSDFEVAPSGKAALAASASS